MGDVDALMAFLSLLCAGLACWFAYWAVDADRWRIRERDRAQRAEAIAEEAANALEVSGYPSYAKLLREQLEINRMGAPC